MEKISKSEKKRQALSAQELGEKLVGLNAGQLGKISLPEEILNAVTLAKTITKRGGLKRQMQYIGGLMRKTDAASIQEAIQELEEGSRRQTELHKQVELWRDELQKGNDAVIEEILRTLPDAGKDQLTELVTRAKNESIKTHPSAAPSRALFRYLYGLAQKPANSAP